MAIKQLLREWRDHIRLLRLREKWREANAGNATEAGTVFPIQAATVGAKTYGIWRLF